MFTSKQRPFLSRSRRPRMRPRRKVRNPIPSARLMALTLSSVFVLSMVGLAWAYVAGSDSAVELDEAGCPVGVTPAKSVTVLIDLTDTRRPAHEQMRRLDSEIRSEVQSIGIGDRLSVIVLASNGSDPADTTELFDRCRPRETGNQIYENKTAIEAAYETGWLQPIAKLRSTIDDHAGKGAPNTPLMASLLDIGRSVKFRATSTRRLIVMTDLLEHDPHLDGFSFYRKPRPTYEEARSKQLLIADNDNVLAGAEVLFLVLSSPQANRHQSETVFDFWSDWMSTAGVADFKFSRI